jgi:glutathione S-transferase
MDKIERVNANTVDPADTLNEQNPLGKIPILLLDDGTALYDSRVICEYLNALAGGALFPAGEARWSALRLQAEADGVLDAGVIQVYEKRYRPEEKWHQPWLDRQQNKIDRTLAYWEASPPSLDGPLHIGHIAMACAFGYLDFRYEGAWRATHPKLVGWLEEFVAKVPAYAETAPQ